MKSARKLYIPQNCRVILEDVFEWLLLKHEEGQRIEDLVRKILALLKEEKYIELEELFS